MEIKEQTPEYPVGQREVKGETEKYFKINENAKQHTKTYGVL